MTPCHIQKFRHALARSPSRNTRGQMKGTGTLAVLEGQPFDVPYSSTKALDLSLNCLVGGAI